MNGVNLDEIFELKPGESRQFDVWIGRPSFEKPGRYRVVFYYQNIPDVKFHGMPVIHDWEAIDRIRKSTPCRLVSEELIVDEPPKGP